MIPENKYDKISDAAGLFSKGDLIFTLNFDTLNFGYQKNICYSFFTLNFEYPEINLLPENGI